MAKIPGTRKIERKSGTLWRARLFLPFDAELGIKPSPIDFYAKTAREADAKRKAYRPEDAKLDKKTPFLDLVRDKHMPTIRQRMEADKISYGHWETSVSLLRRYLLSPDKTKCPNVFGARIRKAKIGLLTPKMFKEYIEACVADGVHAEGVHRIKQQMVAALKEVRDKLAYPIESLFGEAKDALPTQVTNAGKRAVFDPNLIFEIITDITKLVDDRATLAFLFMVQCRPSEMFALTWDDIDLRSGIVTINKAMRLSGKVKKYDDPKKAEKPKRTYGVTDGSKIKKKGKLAEDPGIREVKMPKQLCALLLELKQFRKYMGSSAKWPFLSVEGLQLTGDLWKARWTGIKRRCGLPTEKGAATFYTLKHAGNSWARSQGVSLEAQAAKMGQTSTRMAARDYRFILTEEKQRQADVFDKPTGTSK
jgi:integrase